MAIAELSGAFSAKKSATEEKVHHLGLGDWPRLLEEEGEAVM